MKRVLAVIAGTMFATSLVAGAGSASQDKPKTDTAKTMKATGMVTAVSGNSLTLKSASGEATYMVDAQTRVIGRGAGTKSKEKKAAGEKTVITDFVSNGDQVQVTYHDMGGTKHAASVRVTKKGT